MLLFFFRGSGVSVINAPTLVGNWANVLDAFSGFTFYAHAGQYLDARAGSTIEVHNA